MKPRFVAALTLPLAIAVQAEEPVEEITVTASRTEIAIDNVGSAVHIISRDEIRHRSAQTLADLLRDAPGLALNQNGSIGSLAQVRMRGAEANQVLVLIDGVEANDLTQGNEFNFAHIMTADIERVEIVRGPQSALWGSDALAGVINIITRANRSASNSRIEAEGGSFGTRSLSAASDLIGEYGRLTLGATRVISNGTNISRTGDEDDGYANTTLRAGGEFRLGDNARLQGMLRRIDSTIEFDGTDFVSTGLPIDADNVTDSTQTYARLALVAQITDQIGQTFAYHRTDNDNVNRTATPVDDVTRGRKEALLAQTNVTLGKQRLSIIAEHESEQFRQRGEATAFGDPNKDLDTDRNSIAAEWRYDGDAIHLSASARHEWNSEFEDADTWRVTGLWKVTGATGLFASVGRSIKNPTFTERFGFFDTFTGNPDLEPEEAGSWELGLRYNPDDRLALSASYFESKLEQEINGFVFDAESGGFTARNIDGESERRGAEIDVRWQSTPALSWSATYAWLDSTEPSGGVQIPEVRRPGNTASVRANLALSRLNINVGASHVGDQLDNFFPPFPRASQVVKLNSYTLVDAALRYRMNETVTLSARMENALDETIENVYGYRSPGFAAYAGIEISL